MRFIRNTQTNIVRPSGAIKRLLPWKVSFTLLSTNSTMISTSAWSLVGLPADVFFATPRNRVTKIKPRNTDQNIESTLIAIGLPEQMSAAFWPMFITHSPLSTLQAWRFWR